MKELEFFADVLRILPDKINCIIQAPSIENEEILNAMEDTESSYKIIKLNGHIEKENLIKKLGGEDVFHFQYIEIKSPLSNKKLFEAWDGVEYGAISKDVKIPDRFREKYFDIEMYYVSNEW
jgi:hypothetical protein